MPLNLTDALNQYGFVGTLANSIPELKGIFEQSAREGWDPARFERAVMDSGWWKQNAESARTLATLSVVDPATYNQNLINATDKVHQAALRMGLQGESPQKLQSIALQALLNNWDDQQLQAHLGGTLGSISYGDGVKVGDAAQLDAHMRQVATDYGVSFTDAFLEQQRRSVQGGANTLDGFDAIMRARAKATYPHLAAQIDSGMTVRDIADPYISTMANTLEVSETEIDLSDSWVKRALSNQSPDGVLGALPLWQFERQLKDDPRWDKTKQAREQAFDTVAQVGRDFGFLAGGS